MPNRQAQANNSLLPTKYDPTNVQKLLPNVEGQIWNGIVRQGNLVADCITYDWALSLAKAMNENPKLEKQASAATRALSDLLAALSATASEYQVQEPQFAERISTLVATYKIQAKNAGILSN
jgi:hypothetical protein